MSDNLMSFYVIQGESGFYNRNERSWESDPIGHNVRFSTTGHAQGVLDDNPNFFEGQNPAIKQVKIDYEVYET